MLQTNVADNPPSDHPAVLLLLLLCMDSCLLCADTFKHAQLGEAADSLLSISNTTHLCVPS